MYILACSCLNRRIILHRAMATINITNVVKEDIEKLFFQCINWVKNEINR